MLSIQGANGEVEEIEILKSISGHMHYSLVILMLTTSGSESMNYIIKDVYELIFNYIFMKKNKFYGNVVL